MLLDRHGRAGRRTWVRRALIGVGILFVVLIAVGLLAGPRIVHRVVESGLKDMPEGYSGSIDDVEFRLSRAEIAIIGLQIAKKGAAIPVPYLRVEELLIGTERESWRLRSTLTFEKPVMTLVDAPREADQQWGPPFDLKKLGEQLPFELTRVNLDNAEVHFRNLHAKPPIDVYLHDASVVWSSLVGCLPPGSGACRSKIQGNSKLMQSGLVELTGTFERDPDADAQVRLNVQPLNARELNALLSHYVKIDLEGGKVGADVRARLAGDRRSLLIIPRVANLSAVGGKGDGTSFVRELGVAAVAGWFERKEGSKAIELSGKSGGKLDFRLVDLDESADSKKD